MKLIFWTILVTLACSNLRQYKMLPYNSFKENSFEGKWDWVHNSEKRDFSVTIKYNRDTLSGTYCSIMQAGSRIDCGNGDVSFSTEIPIRDTLITSFNSFYQEGTGKVQLTLAHKDTLKWIILERPSVPCFAPDSAMLVKE